MLGVLRYLENTKVKKFEIIEFDKNNIKQHIDDFEKYKNKGILKNNKFEDKEWIILAGSRDRIITFEFNETSFKKLKNRNIIELTFDDFIVSIKCYILSVIENHTANKFYTLVTKLKLALKEDIFLDKNLKNSSKKKSFLTSYYIIYEYILYLGIYFNNEEFLNDFEEYYLDYVTDSSKQNKSKRSLPTFDTMFKFNDVIEDFIKTSTGEKREKYFPIILWWKITTIIPLRTHELLIIPKECIRMEPNRYILKFYRNKIKGKSSNFDNFGHTFNEYYKEEEFPISNDVAKLILEYKKIVDKYDKELKYFPDGFDEINERQFLFSYRSYRKYKNYSHIMMSKNEFFGSSQINLLKNEFLYEIITKEYGFEMLTKSKNIKLVDYNQKQIEYIQCMDTRHFSILNMVYMGYEASTIQRIIGHKSINTSYSYSNHSEIFAQCYTISLAKQMAISKNLTHKYRILNMNLSELLGEPEGSANKRYRDLKNKKDMNTRKIRLEEGYCIYNNEDMLPCKMLNGNHKRCKYYIPDNDKIGTISDELQCIDDEINVDIKTLIYLMKNKRKIIGYKEAYKTIINKIHSNCKNKAEIICDYIINV